MGRSRFPRSFSLRSEAGLRLFDVAERSAKQIGSPSSSRFCFGGLQSKPIACFLRRKINGATGSNDRRHSHVTLASEKHVATDGGVATILFWKYILMFLFVIIKVVVAIYRNSFLVNKVNKY